MTKTELLALADALKVADVITDGAGEYAIAKSIAALREYAATMEQEPVAWRAALQEAAFALRAPDDDWKHELELRALKLINVALDVTPSPQRTPLIEALQQIANWPGRERAWPAEGEMIDLARAALASHGITAQEKK
jgi:hypothetical protein